MDLTAVSLTRVPRSALAPMGRVSCGINGVRRAGLSLLVQSRHPPARDHGYTEYSAELCATGDKAMKLYWVATEWCSLLESVFI